jgi:carbonic anhydrase
MSVIDQLVSANEGYVRTFPGARPVAPKLRLTVIACMDSRLDLFGALGLDIGDAHLIRNAGGLVTDDVLRSLAVSQRKLGTASVLLLHHTNCGMEGLDDAAFRAELARETGVEPPWDTPGFTDVYADMRASIGSVRSCRWIPHRDDVRGFIFDVATAQINEVVVAAG